MRESSVTPGSTIVTSAEQLDGKLFANDIFLLFINDVMFLILELQYIWWKEICVF